MSRLAWLALVTSVAIGAATKVSVIVAEAKTGKAVKGLQTTDFIVTDDKAPKSVEAVETTSGPLDIMLLLDTSLVGAAVQPVAANLIGQLQPKDQVAVVSFHSSADLIQEFTSSKELLNQAVAKVRYGNTPRLMDALFAAIDGGFENTVYRRVILLLTTGFEGGSRVSDKQVIRAARRNGVSIVPVFIAGVERRAFEELARQTGGASFNLQELKRTGVTQPGPRVFETLRQYYVLTIAGSLELSDKLKVEVRNQPKLFVSALPQE